MSLKNKDELYNLRNATLEDAQLLFGWVNDPKVREMSINSNMIYWQGHLNWLIKKLESQTCKIFILEQNDIPVGQIRFEYFNEEWGIDYSIGKQYRGQGLGQVILELSIPFFCNYIIRAIVKQDNLPSNKIFKNLGFTLKGDEKINGISCFIYIMRV